MKNVEAELSKIGAVKIFDANGNLKKFITSEEATKMHSKYYVLSPNERKLFDRFKGTEKIKKYQPWIYGRSRVVREAKYKVTCPVCQQTAMRRSEKAVFCSRKCNYKNSNDKARGLA